ncbi:MAG: glycosyltransferase family 2 protein, partial [Acidobacteriaceae bacterium]
IRELLEQDPPFDGYRLPRRNLFLGRWMRYGGFYPDRKLRLFRRGAAEFEVRPVHETLHFVGNAGQLKGDMVHDAYLTLEAYIAHMDRYSSLGAGYAVRQGKNCHALWPFLVNVVANPVATFIYNYFFRLGFLDGREGLLLHLYHSVYVSWKYAKAWEKSSNH